MSQTIVTTLEVDARPAEAGISAYERAMQRLTAEAEKAAARQAKIDAAMAGAAGAARLVTQATDRAAQSWTRLQAAADPAFVAQAKFERAANQAAAAVRGGAASYDQAAAALDKLRAKQEAQARAAELAASGTQFSAEALRMTYDTAYASAARYAEVEQQVREHVEARTLTVEQGNAILAGAGERFKQMGREAAAANDNVRLTAGQMQGLGYQVNDIATMFAMGSSPFQIIASQAGQIIQVLQEGPGGVRGSLTAMKDGLIDGAKSALGMAAAFGPLKIAAAAAGVALVGYAAVAWLRLEPLDDLIDAQAKRIAALKDAYGIASEGADDYGKRSAAALARQSAKEVQSDRGRLQDEASEVLGRLFQYERRSAQGVTQFDSLAAAAGAFRASVDAGKPAYIALDRALEAIAKSDAPQTIRDLAGEQADLIAPLVAVERGMTAETKAMDQGAVAAARLRQSIAEVRGELAGLVPDVRTEAERINDAVATAMEYARSPGEADSILRLGRAAMAPINESAADILRDERATRAAAGLNAEAAAIAEVNARYDRLAEDYAGAADALRDLDRARAEAIAGIKEQAAREEEARRAGVALDFAQVTARTTAEQAEIARQRELIDLRAQGIVGIEAEARAKEAADLVFAQGAETERRSALARQRGREDTVRALKVEAEVYGMSEGAALAYRLQVEQLVALQRERADAGGIVTPEEVEQIRQAAQAAGMLADAMSARRRFEGQEMDLRRLQAEADTITSSDAARRRALVTVDAENELRREGIDLASQAARAYVDNAVALSDYEAAVRRSADAWDVVRSAGESAIDGIFDRLAEGDFEGALKSVGSEIAKMLAEFGKNGLKNAILGTDLPTFADLFNPAKAPTLSGAQAVSAMTVTASVVNLNASGLGLAGGAAAGQGGAAGAIADNFGLGAGSGTATAGMGQGLSYAARFRQGVDQRLMTILDEAAKRSDMRVEAISGLRPGDKRYHGRGLAADVQLYDASGRALNNYQNVRDFRAYERFAQTARTVQMERFPELGDKFRWGGYFSGGKGTYGALDTMHFDLAGIGMAGGSWANGLTAAQRRRWAGVESIGMAQGGAMLSAGGSGLMSRYRDAIAAIESLGSGGYGALGPVTRSGDRAYGRYQMMGSNIGPWSQAALGRRLSASQFMADPLAQDRIFDHVFGGYVSRYGEGGAAQAWFGGPGSVGRNGRRDMLGTSVGGYGEKFAAELAKLPAAGSHAVSAATAFASSSSDAMSGIGQTLNNTLLGGIGAVADRFVPGLGGVLTSLLQDIQAQGGRGGGGGLLGSLLGGGGSFFGAGAVAFPGAGVGGLYADGGYTGPGGKWDPAGVVHRDEIVWSKENIRNAGGVAVVEAMRLGLRGYADGGPVAMSASPIGAWPGVKVIDMRGAGAPAIEQRTTRDENGGMQVELTVRELVKDEVSSRGRGTNGMLQRAGVRQPLRQFS